MARHSPAPLHGTRPRSRRDQHGLCAGEQGLKRPRSQKWARELTRLSLWRLRAFLTITLVSRISCSIRGSTPCRTLGVTNMQPLGATKPGTERPGAPGARRATCALPRELALQFVSFSTSARDAVATSVCQRRAIAVPVTALAATRRSSSSGGTDSVVAPNFFKWPSASGAVTRPSAVLKLPGPHAVGPSATASRPAHVRRTTRHGNGRCRTRGGRARTSSCTQS